MRAAATRLLHLLTLLALTSCSRFSGLEPVPPPPLPPPEPPPQKEAAPAPPRRPVIPAPKSLGTPASSLAAAPAWWRKWWRKHRPAYAPQPHKSWELYRRADKETSRVDRIHDALLACRVAVGAFHESKLAGAFRPGAFSKADLLVNAVVRRADPPRSTPDLFVQGGEDDNSMLLTIPLVRMDKGDELRLNVGDRDFIGGKLIEKLTLPFSGSAPLLARGSRASASCRLVPRDKVEQRLAERARPADEALDRAERRYRPSLSARRFDRDSAVGKNARLHVEELAGLVGWDDPRVRARVERMEGLDRRFDELFGRLFDQQLAALPAPGAWSPLAGEAVEVRQVSHRCGKAVLRAYRRFVSFVDLKSFTKAPCALHLQLRHNWPRPVTFKPFGNRLRPLEGLEYFDRTELGGELRLAAMVIGGKVQPKPRQDPVLAPGQVIEVVYLPRGPGPFLVRSSHQAGLLRLTPGPWRPIADTGVRVRLVKLACAGQVTAAHHRALPVSAKLAPGGCVVHLVVENQGEWKLVLDYESKEFGHRSVLQLVDDKDQRRALTPYATVAGGKITRIPEDFFRHNRLELKRGDSAEVVFIVEGDQAGLVGSGAPLLRYSFLWHRAATFFRVEAAAGSSR